MRSFWTTVLAVSCLSSVSLGAPAILVNTMTWDIQSAGYWTLAQQWLQEKGLASVYYDYGNNGVVCDTPDIRLKNFKNYVPSDTRFLAMSGHGYWDTLHFYMPEFYASYTAAFNAAVDYETWSDYDYQYVDAFDSGGTELHGFAASTQGIAQYLRPSDLPAGAIVYGGYCGSFNDAAGWRCTMGTQSYSGYLGEPDFETVFWNLGRFVFRLTCHPDSTAGVSRALRLPAARDAVSGGGEPLLRLSDLSCIDNSDIMLSASKSGCAVLDVRLDVQARQGRRVYLGVSSAPLGSCYFLDAGAGLDSLALGITDRLDSHGRSLFWCDIPTCCDSFSVLQTFSGVATANTGRWYLLDVPERALESFPTEDDFSYPQLSAEDAQSFADSLSAEWGVFHGYDAVVATSNRVLADLVVADLESQGKSVAPIVRLGITPEMIRDGYKSVVFGNARAPGVWPTDPGPTLYIVGNAPAVGYTNIGGDASDCGGYCLTDYRCTDVDDDGLPDGPVTRVPGSTAVEIQAVLASAADFRQGANVNSQRRAMFFCDDWDFSWVQNMRTIGQCYDAIGYSDGVVIRRSQLPQTERARFERFRDVVNAGVAELWAFGFSAEYEWGSLFKLSPYGSIGASDFAGFSVPQVFVAWAPTCHTALTSSNMSVGSVAGALMFPQSGSAAHLAGFVGRVSGGGDVAEYLLARALAAARRDGVPGVDSLADVVFRGVRAFADEYPMYLSCALGTSVLGGNVLLAPLDEAADATLDLVSSPRVKIEAASFGSTVRFRYSVPATARGRGHLALYDVRGRLVRDMDMGQVAEDGTVEWNGCTDQGRPVSSGLYLALFVVRGEGGAIQSVARASILR
jgi:hypothetical protein